MAFIAICFAVMSCTKAKTDYEAEISTVVTEHYEFKEAASISSDGYKISIEALNGTFYKGYNEIRLKVTTQTNQPVNASAVTFLPVMTGPMKANLPVRTGTTWFIKPGIIVFRDTWYLQMKAIPAAPGSSMSASPLIINPIRQSKVLPFNLKPIKT